MSKPHPLELRPKKDPRMRTYDEIGRVHRQLVEAGRRAQLANMRLNLDPSLIVHCEKGLAFLAEEVLRLFMAVDAVSAKVKKDDVEQDDTAKV